MHLLFKAWRLDQTNSTAVKRELFPLQTKTHGPLQIVLKMYLAVEHTDSERCSPGMLDKPVGFPGQAPLWSGPAGCTSFCGSPTLPEELPPTSPEEKTKIRISNNKPKGQMLFGEDGFYWKTDPTLKFCVLANISKHKNLNLEWSSLDESQSRHLMNTVSNSCV